jgi:hypothetical protein
MSERKYLLDNEKATAPLNQVGTGTIETNKLGIIGTGTLFKTELARGAHIVNLATGEILMVSEVVSDTYAILMEPFGTEIAASTALNFIASWKGNAREISTIVPVYKQDGVTENTFAVIDGTDVAPGIGENASKVHRDRSGSVDTIRPIFIDATGTQVLVDVIF